MIAIKRLYLFGLVVLIVAGAHIFTSCNFDGGESAPRETQAPEVDIMLDPILPEHGDHITFIAAAEDDSGIDTLAIFVDGENVEQCQGNRTDTRLQCSCTLGPYNEGQIVEYWAVAVDYQGNNRQSRAKRIEVLPIPIP